MSRPDKVSQQILGLLDQYHALSALEIQEKLAEQGHKLNKTSVYRSLERLLDQKNICRYLFEGTTAVYERRDHHHDHLVCQNCGRVQTIPCTLEVPQEVAGFMVDHHHVTMFGICAECRSRTQTPVQVATDQLHPAERA